MSFDELVDLYSRYKVLKENTIKSYRECTKAFLNEFPDLSQNILAVTEEHALNFRNIVIKRARHSSYNKYRRHLLALFNFAAEVNLVPANPFKKVKGLPELKHLKKTVEHEGFLTVLGYLKSRESHVDAFYHPAWFWKAVINMLYYTAMRPSQLVALEWRDIDQGRKIVLLRAETSKTKREWMVPLHSMMIPHLQRLQKEYLLLYGKLPDKTDQVFNLIKYVRDGDLRKYKKMRLDDIQRTFKKIRKATGVNINAYAIRHTTATFIANRGNVKVAQEILGHTDIKTTYIYVHPDIDWIRGELQQISVI